ncbi:uncharacterized protein I303_102558 [Kwoniella dejecticola CBS 10117]|uniref:Phosphatidylglycerol/phosphatidylinositol transfer protein n=1 Tax=Kwoniella dejecticola CBS 10117 TaxID=1296121 RepID=A0A1A6A931_9TREE|nr:uncharacterized protein I303_02572 [Kwoniella dejecticola CBS 10117]OBR86564.1 hypothetical protein I303_02572 [Kwoniella dejecticola CBS 10117]
MFLRSTILSALLLWTATAVASPLHLSKREVSIVKLTTAPTTRLTHENDVSQVAVDGQETTFDFTRKSPAGSQDTGDSYTQTFYCDLFKKDTDFHSQEQLARLTCYVEVPRTFRGTAKYQMHTNEGEPAVTLTSGEVLKVPNIHISCPPDEAKCIVDGAHKECLSRKPGFEDNGNFKGVV